MDLAIDVFESEKRLLRLLQGTSNEILLRLAIECRLDTYLAQLTITPEMVMLMKQAGWIEDGSMTPGDDELRRTVGACISGIAGFFLYWNIPIDAAWTECDRNPDFVREIILAYPPEIWGERLAMIAHVKGIPHHLIEGMLIYAMFDIPMSVN